MPDPKTTLTKRRLLEALADFPDDHPILINVEFADGENWDTYHAVIQNWSEMCPGGQGCTHGEPEMFWEAVLFVKFSDPDSWTIKID